MLLGADVYVVGVVFVRWLEATGRPVLQPAVFSRIQQMTEDARLKGKDEPARPEGS